MLVHSVLHNPTSSSLSAAKAYRILQLADAHNFALIEDNVYRDLYPGDSQGRSLAATRVTIPNLPAAGIFLGARAASPWACLDTDRVAARMMEHGYLLAPASLFSPTQLPGVWMRFNIATSNNPDRLAALARTLEAVA